LFVDTGVKPILPHVDPVDVPADPVVPTEEDQAEKILQEEKAARRAAAVAKAQEAAKVAREKKKAEKEAKVQQ
jgi:hypothetical protein